MLNENVRFILKKIQRWSHLVHPDVSRLGNTAHKTYRGKKVSEHFRGEDKRKHGAAGPSAPKLPTALASVVISTSNGPRGMNPYQSRDLIFYIYFSRASKIWRTKSARPLIISSVPKGGDYLQEQFNEFLAIVLSF